MRIDSYTYSIDNHYRNSYDVHLELANVSSEDMNQIMKIGNNVKIVPESIYTPKFAPNLDEYRVIIGGRGNRYIIPSPKKVIFNDPATIVIWTDGTKTVVKCQDGDQFDREKGLALCYAKKFSGNKSNFNNIFKKWIEEE